MYLDIISFQVNTIMRLVFELGYCETAAQHYNYYARETLPNLKWCERKWDETGI